MLRKLEDPTFISRTYFKKTDVRVGKMTQWVKAPAVVSDHLNSFPIIHMVEKEY